MDGTVDECKWHGPTSLKPDRSPTNKPNQVGYKRPLEMNDIWLVNPDRSAAKLSAKLRESFKRRVKKGEQYPLLWALHETFFWEFWSGGLFQLISTVFQVMSPFTLRFLIQFASDAYVASRRGLPPPDVGAGVALAFGITFMQILQSLGVNHFIYRGMMIGGQARGVLISLIFEKAMVLSGRARAGGKEIADGGPQLGGKALDPKMAGKQEKRATKLWRKISSMKKKKTEDGQLGVSGDGAGWANGRIVNLMSVDTYRVDQAAGLFHMTWTAPIACIITLVVLLINLTYSALAGFSLLVIGVPLLTRAVKNLFKRRKHINKITDQRVSLTQEILQSVRFVKFFGWESAFLARLQDIRGREIYSIQVLLAIRNAINAVSMALPIFASMLAFITYSLSDHGLAPAEVFSSLALFNGLRMPLNLLPLVIGQVVDAWSSLKRIQEFLVSEEQEDEAEWQADAPNAVEMRGASFTWERTTTQGPEKSFGGSSDKGKSKDRGQQQQQESGAEAKKNASVGKQPAEKAEVGEKTQAGPSEGSSGDSTSTLVEEREPFKLQDLNFEVGRNELVAVIGTVGSGKSSLLAALAGDMRKTGGEVIFGASRAFCPQYSWIQNATVRQNILFGKEMDKGWYREVIDA